MKKTITINISGSIFHIDEDAYEKLQSYLQMLNRHFGDSEDGREILQDIESRIAELFSEKMEDGKDVISDAWVEEVMKRMGKPEDFMEAEEEETKIPSGTASPKSRRRMYRDPDRRVIGGVCAGMGAYFNIDPVVLRVIFFVLFWITGGAALFIYVLLWIAVPKARTTAQKLEMRGEEATVSNIEKSIREEVREVKASYQRLKKSDTYEKGKDVLSQLGDLVYNVLKVTLKVFVILVGALLILAGFFGLLGFLSSVIIGHSFLNNAPFIAAWGPDFPIPGLFTHLVSQGSFTISMILIVLLVAIPILAILFIGTKLIFRYKTNNKIIGLASVGIWFAALFAFILVVVGQVNNFSKRTSTTSSTTIEGLQYETLMLELGEDKYVDTDYEIALDNMKMIMVNDEEVLLGVPRLDIEKSSGDHYAVVVKKQARGKNQDDARENAEEIVYNFLLTDSVLQFDPYFTLEEGGKWRDQEVDIDLKVPVGKSVYLGEKLNRILYGIDNVNNIWEGDMTGKSWIMTPDGLELKE